MDVIPNTMKYNDNAFNNIKLYNELLEPLARTLWNNF